MTCIVNEVFQEYLSDSLSVCCQETNKGIDWDIESMKKASEEKEKRKAKIAFCASLDKRQVTKVKPKVRTVKKIKNPNKTHVIWKGRK